MVYNRIILQILKNLKQSRTNTNGTFVAPGGVIFKSYYCENRIKYETDEAQRNRNVNLIRPLNFKERTNPGFGGSCENYWVRGRPPQSSV